MQLRTNGFPVLAHQDRLTKVNQITPYLVVAAIGLECHVTVEKGDIPTGSLVTKTEVETGVFAPGEILQLKLGPALGLGTTLVGFE